MTIVPEDPVDEYEQSIIELAKGNQDNRMDDAWFSMNKVVKVSIKTDLCWVEELYYGGESVPRSEEEGRCAIIRN